MQTQGKLRDELIQWLQVFVAEFRRQYELLPNEAKRRLSSLSDFRPPCQILVFWASEPDYQDILIIREPKLTGDSIRVYGPAPPERMIAEADSMLKDRWFHSSPEPARSSLEQVYKAMVQDKLLGIIRILPRARLSLPPRDGKGVPIVKRGSGESNYFEWTLFGSLLSFNPVKFAVDTISEAVKPGGVGQPVQEAPRVTNAVPLSDAPSPNRNGFISAFYPPIWLGEHHTFSFREKVTGYFIPVSTTKIRLHYKNRELTVMLNGLLTMLEPDKQTCSDLLNEIMCTTLLLGIPCTAVRDEDLSEAKFYDSGDWGEYSSDLGKRRTRSLEMEMSPINEEEFSGFKSLSEADLRSIIARAEEATSIREQSDYSRWYIDAHTYQIDGGYDQAVVKSWLIIEQHIKSMFAILARRDVPPRKTLPSNDAMLRKLLEAGRISADQYKNLDSLRSRRNDIVHRGSVTASEESQEFLRVAESLTRAITGISKPVY